MPAAARPCTAHRPLTARQQEMIEVIRRYTAEHGRPPTLRDIGEAMGIRSTNGVLDHVKALEAKGVIERKAKISRGLTVVRDGQDRTGVWPAWDGCMVGFTVRDLQAARHARAIALELPEGWALDWSRLRGDDIVIWFVTPPSPSWKDGAAVRAELVRHGIVAP